eukprot:Tbor_TRINITY_DN5097_c1_g1::TRINITY_DN5097_c1_g1_i1::g.14008::m.14008/K05868/CCNB1; G2/mitotic-specific cyclin-B1
MSSRFGSHPLRDSNINSAPAPFSMKTEIKNTSVNSSGSSQEFSKGFGIGLSRSASNNNLNTVNTNEMISPEADRRFRHVPANFPSMVKEISEMFFDAEVRHCSRESNPLRAKCLSNQTEVTEKMRAIVVDWLVDVMQKFRLHAETFYLAVEIMDCYLAVATTTRSQLQLVGITSLLLAAKYEEMWAPDLRECVKITANTYNRDDILKMERAIAGALQFRFTVPTPYPFLVRLLQVTNADTITQHAAFFFLEHATMDYKHLCRLPSELACASMYLANVLLNKPNLWEYELEYYGRKTASQVKPVASEILAYCQYISSVKYQAIRRKYSNTKYGEITSRPLPTSL